MPRDLEAAGDQLQLRVRVKCHRLPLMSYRPTPTLLSSSRSFGLSSFLSRYAIFVLCSSGTALSAPPPLLGVLAVRLPRRKLIVPTMKGAKDKGPAKKETKQALKPVDDRKAGKRKAAQKAEKSSKRHARKEKRAKKDPNKPKRPPSAFFVFLEEFRKQFKQEHPNVKAVSAVGKAGGEKWKSMTDAEKEPFEAKAAKKKNEYEKQMAAYNKKQESVADDDEESDRSKSEINDEDDEESGEEEDEDED